MCIFGWDRFVSLGHPCKFRRVSLFGSVTARHSSNGRQPNFAALNRGRHLYSAGRPSRWALVHISSWVFRQHLNTSENLMLKSVSNWTELKCTFIFSSICWVLKFVTTMADKRFDASERETRFFCVTLSIFGCIFSCCELACEFQCITNSQLIPRKRLVSEITALACVEWGIGPVSKQRILIRDPVLLDVS